MRNVWQVATQPFPGAHFATFPPKLIAPCVAAGTSERGVCAACGAPQVRQFGSIGRPSDARSIEPKCRGNGAILRDSISAALGVSAMRHIWPRGTQNSSRTPAYARRGASEGIQTKWWSNDAIFARGASRRETRAPHRPTSYGPMLHHFVSDRRRPHGKRYPTLRWPVRLETAPKKTIAAHFAWFLAVFSA